MSFCIRILFQVALAEKLRLKNSGLRVKRKKLQFHLKQKEESGEVRHEVDFEQLKIENKQFAEKFEARNQELLQLKLKSGNTMQVLNSYKVCCWEGPSDPLVPPSELPPVTSVLSPSCVRTEEAAKFDCRVKTPGR